MFTNYFNYFTEIEEHFQRRRGSILMLSTVDWALIETWREAGIPLEAVLRGIDDAFEKYDARKSRANVRKVNGLAYCAQAIMTAAEEMKEASIGSHAGEEKTQPSAGFEQERIATYLESSAHNLQGSTLQHALVEETAARLMALAAEVRQTLPQLEELDRTLTVLEERLFAACQTSASEADLTAIREQAQRDLAPYRSRMKTMQIRQVEQQFLHKKLLEHFGIPRLSLFYMSQQ